MTKCSIYSYGSQAMCPSGSVDVTFQEEPSWASWFGVSQKQMLLPQRPCGAFSKFVSWLNTAEVMTSSSPSAAVYLVFLWSFAKEKEMVNSASRLTLVFSWIIAQQLHRGAGVAIITPSSRMRCVNTTRGIYTLTQWTSGLMKASLHKDHRCFAQR